MLVSYKWLNQLIDIQDITPDVLADKMSRSGIEVEEVNVAQDGLKKIVVGDVKECVPHPDSDHLSICQIDVGEEELYQIVCGAPNIRAGKKVIVALPNSRITGNVKIKKGKMRGEVSLGMVCSLGELGYSDSVVPKEYADGIYFLPDDAKAGDEVFSYLDMDDAIIELSVTPNRADALSMRGVAYEVGAIYGRNPHFETKALIEDENDTIENYVSVAVESKDDAPVYRMRVIKDVTVKESPSWLQNLLMNEGIRPVNNVVDVTNYVLLLFGQPQHAFDYAKLNSKEVSVRRAQDEEKLTTLDGVERELAPNNLVITNGQKAIALAGVMGGEETEIDKSTTVVALETALFEPVLIRRTARSFGLSSESSKRFERGINTGTISEASDFAAAMIAELSGGTVVKGEAISVSPKKPLETVSITLEKINNSLGTTLSLEEVNTIFANLQFDYELEGEKYTVTVPTRRWDISIEADLVEEVARIYGYDNLPSTLPKGSSLAGRLSHSQKLTREIRHYIEGNGLVEAISYALTTPKSATRFVLEPKDVVTLDWPMSEERSVLRQSLTSTLLEDVRYNLARKNNRVALYEIGNVFEATSANELPVETKHLSFAISGEWQANDWQGQAQQVDFYTLKGVIESVLTSLGLIQDTRFEPIQDAPDLHPGRTALVVVKDEVVGFIGQVHPLTAKELDISETYVSELNLEKLCELVPTMVDFKEVGKYPSVKRDIALLVNQEVSHQEILDVIYAKAGKHLKRIELFDIYQGEKLGAGKKSLAYSLIFQNDADTLVDEEITNTMTKITDELVAALGAEIR
ncbi:phenylalanine--tRNA ligase subunit beta [Vagococcus silagei]|uniref:Phenylalanine--tRNA ligase beta subunit n=1 Tax=Vagococcus silagei TaxID=2508885 RepID=A0A4S3B6C2_9ENTE|nr:phenylalanine--tRNA ligase subunit beta [Vagococcus silagei]THB61273.1 phenylalanine--tRNA ligase subunit beta [Vagococcus silagei]